MYDVRVRLQCLRYFATFANSTENDYNLRGLPGLNSKYYQNVTYLVMQTCSEAPPDFYLQHLQADSRCALRILEVMVSDLRTPGVACSPPTK